MSENIYTRELLLKSFHGEPRAAFNAIVNAMPIAGPFMQAMRILDCLVEIERADTEHPRAEVGS